MARKPQELFAVGNRISVTSARSKHYARTAVIDKVRTRRLTVSFEDGKPGKYVDYQEVIKLEPTKHTSEQGMEEPSSNTTTQNKKTNDTTKITRLLEHMAFTSATLISLHHDDLSQMKALLDTFSYQVHNHVQHITST